MIPLRDDNPTRTFPVVTAGLIGLNVAAFLFEMLLESQGEATLAGFIRANGLIPLEITRQADFPPTHIGPTWVTLFTSMFLHGGYVHIIGNMLYLWIFGNNIEDVLGHVRFLLFYLLSGIVAGLTHVFVQPTSLVPTIGASGAVAGVLGTYILLFPRAQVDTLFIAGYFIRLVRLPALVVLGFWIVLQFFSGFASLGTGESGGVAWFAHIGGFVVGLVVALGVRAAQRAHRSWL